MLSAAFWSRELRRGKKSWDAQEMSRRERRIGTWEEFKDALKSENDTDKIQMLE